MAEILQCSDLTTHKIHDDGLEAPRNSFDFPTAPSHKNPLYDDNMTVRQKPSKVSISHRKTTAKMVMDKEMPNQADGSRNVPSVVARLMGMDAIPTPGKDDAPLIQAKETKAPKPGNAKEIKAPKLGNARLARMSRAESGATHCNSPQSAPFKQSKCSLLSYGTNGDTRHSRDKNWRPRRSRSREHPQEELLRKFKEDFQAWQTSKVLEDTKTVALEDKPGDGKYIQILAQENLNKEKMARYADAKKNLAEKKVSEKVVMQEGDPKCRNGTEKQCGERVIEVQNVTDSEKSENCKDLEGGEDDDHNRSMRSPTRIVILKPSCDKRADAQEPWFGSSKIKRDCSMEEFVEEVKQKLKMELQGKPRSKPTGRSEASFSERLADPKQIARDIAKQIRETVTRDLGKSLSRSESFRAYRSDRKNMTAGQESRDHVKIDTRKILMERLKSVLRTETAPLEKPVAGEEVSRASFPIQNRGRVRSMTDFPLSGIGWEEQKATSECATRHKIDNMVSVDADVVSPRTLIRSFSAPASGTSLGKLFLEESEILTGAETKRKHETFDRTSKEAKPCKNNRSSLRGRVSNLRHNFSFGGKLFGRKTHWSKKPSASEFHPLKVIRTTSSSPMNFGVTQDNFTELPPSPASVSSSSHNEFSAQDNPSPVSPLEVEGHASRHFFRDLDCNLPELSLKSSSGQVETEEFDAAVSELSYKTDTTEMESHDRAYIREILVAAGLYEVRAIDETNARVDSMARPISYDMFEEVEEAYSRDKKAASEDTVLYCAEATMDHRLLFDLANEALQSLVGCLMTGSTLCRWIIDSTGVPQGKKLVDDLWHQVQILRNPPMDEMQTIDSMVAREVRKAAWLLVLYADIYVLGRKIERAVFDELIDDIVQEIFF